MVAIECLEDCPVVNTPLVQLSELFPDLMATVVGVWRNERLFVPHSTDQLETGDLAYVVCDRDHVRRTLGPLRPRGAGGGPHRHLGRRQYRLLRRRRH
jgi:trk system potassium uptake protein TrkA